MKGTAMKKILIMALMSCTVCFTAQAQEVYKRILKVSKQTAADKSKSLDVRKVATFKVDELNYMAMKSKELMPDSTVRMLDRQAYAMHEFINLFFNRLSEAKKKAQKELVMARFKNASISNSRFNDTDKELVLSYYDNSNYMTQFSLDTDWVKALAEVRRKK